MLFAFPYITRDPYLTQILTLALLFAYMASCLNIVLSCGQWSLAHAMFVGIGAYTSTLFFVNLNVSPWLSVLVGSALAAVAALVIAIPLFRLRTLYFCLASLAIAEALRLWIIATPEIGGWATGQTRGLRIPSVSEWHWLYFQSLGREFYYYVILFMLLGLLAFLYWLWRSKLRYQFEAVRNDEDGAASLGINITRVKTISLVLSAALLAPAGTFYTQLLQYASPATLLSVKLSFMLLLMVMLGGIGTLSGPIIGAVVFGPLDGVVRGYLGGAFAGLNLVIMGTVVVLLVLFLPRGVHYTLARGYWWVIERLERLVPHSVGSTNQRL